MMWVHQPMEAMMAKAKRQSSVDERALKMFASTQVYGRITSAEARPSTRRWVVSQPHSQWSLRSAATGRYIKPE